MIDLINARILGVGLKIQEVRWHDPSLGIVGKGWTFNTTSAWRVLGVDGRLAFAWESNTADDLKSLVGKSIVSVSSQSPRMTGDPAFELSDGRWLEVFACHATDPWVLSLPEMTYVGNPSSML